MQYIYIYTYILYCDTKTISYIHTIHIIHLIHTIQIIHIIH